MLGSGGLTHIYREREVRISQGRLLKIEHFSIPDIAGREGKLTGESHNVSDIPSAAAAALAAVMLGRICTQAPAARQASISSTARTKDRGIVKTTNMRPLDPARPLGLGRVVWGVRILGYCATRKSGFVSINALSESRR